MTAFVAAILLTQSASPRPELSKGQEVAYAVSMTYRDIKEADVVTRQEWRLSYKTNERGLVGTRRLLKMNIDGNEIKLDKVEDETWIARESTAVSLWGHDFTLGAQYK